jgi:arylsulfatase A-like enzyme
MQAPAKYLDRFPNIADNKRRTYAAMLSAMDDAIGAVLKKLRESGLEKNTFIVFISDNGGPTRANAARNEPLSGVKGQVREGGIRVPLLVHWKGHLPAGKVYEQPVIALDLFPTLLAAAGGKVPDDRVIDGVDLLPYLSGKKRGAPHEALFWRFGAASAVRKGKWKLVKTDENAPQLFDLDQDIGEKNNLAAQRPEVIRDLTAAFSRWDAQMIEPLWRPRRQ